MCSKCKKEKDQSEFFKNKARSNGLHNQCKRCFCDYIYKSRKSKKGKEYLRKYRKTKKAMEYRKAYSITEKNRAYRREYTKTEKYKKWRRLYSVKRSKMDPAFRVDHGMRTLVCRGLRNKKAGRSWENLVGYTTQDLIIHLEKQFDEHMTWDNYGPYWHVDHIIPKSSFHYKTAEEESFKKCWALDNLQPMEKMENLKKSNKISPLDKPI